MRNWHALALTCAILTVCAAQAADVALWHELDIVPMPKEIQMTDRVLSLEGAVVVLGERPSRQDEIGAQWLSDECVAHGGEALSAVTAGTEGAARLRIVVGTVESNPIIGAAARAGQIDVGPDNPGERGYVIAPREEGGATVLLLAGADPLGALYACVTLGELFRDGDAGPVCPEVTVRDWPDFVDMTFGAGYTGDTRGADIGRLFADARNAADPSPELREAFLTGMREHYDRLLRWKISSLWMNMYESSPPAGRALVREAVDYGKERGIGALYYAKHPFVGPVADFPDYDGPKLPPGRYPNEIRCWSLDEMRRQTAEKFAKLVGDVGYTDVGFHDTDTGGFLNPAQWEERCDVCRERWGDDYASATVNKFRIWYDALKEHAPDARMHIVIYPYSLGIYTQEGAEAYLEERYGPGPGIPDAARRLREKWEAFYRRVTAELPDDITFCIREQTPDKVDAYRDLIGERSIFIFFKLLADPWTAFFSESPRWTGTFYRDSGDFLFPPTLETFCPIQALTVREYAWNINAPGAEPFARLPVEEQWRHCEPRGEIYEVVLPHVVRNFFGPRYAEQIAGALSCNLNPYEVFERKLFGGNPSFLGTYERWQWQADEATRGALLLDEVWEQRQGPDDRLGMTQYAFRRLVYLREIFHCSRYMATAMASNMLARKLAAEGDLDAAAAAVRAGREAAETGRADAERLLAERPEDRIYERADLPSGREAIFRLFTPDAGVDWEVPLKRLAQTEEELPALVAAGGVDQEILEDLDRRRAVHAGRARGAITIDGSLDEPDWSAVYPSESFFVYGAERKIADTPTQARMLHDDATVYVGFSCWLPGDGQPFAQQREHDDTVLQDDSVEVFLAPPQLGGGYVHLMVNALGSVRDQLGTAVKDDAGVTRLERDPTWNADGLQVAAASREGRWDVEIAIPLSDLGAESVGPGWRANLTRQYHSANETHELSSILPTGIEDFHDRANFRPVTFTDADFSAPPPEIELVAAGFEAKVETLDDRIATVCRLGLEVHCSRALHDVTITAEAFGPDGAPQRQAVLAQLPRILYDWQPDETFELQFAEQVDAGGVKLLLQSHEAQVERWVRFGGWQGSAQAGSLFAEGLSGQALSGDCVLPSRVTVAGEDEPVPLVESRAGTVELWLRPDWTGRELPLTNQFDLRRTRYCLLHMGPLRPDHPYLANHSSLALEVFAPDLLRCSVTAPIYAGWSASVDLNDFGGLEAGRWHHLAVVWDGDAPRDDWLRVYVDGVRRSRGVSVAKEERFGDDPSLRVTTESPYPIQLGCLTSGRCPARGLIDELRISRGARYSDDFEPTRGPAEADAQSSLVLRFDGGLVGEGRSASGAKYTVEAVPGVPEYH